MTSSLFTELLKAVAILGVFLLIGAFLRAKAPFFRKLLLPASVIGGFLALIVGPRVLNLIPFSEDYLNTWSLLPSILIVPIFAAAPLGNGMGADRARKKKGLLQYGPSVLLMCALFSTVSCLQGVVGYGVNLVFTAMGWDLYRTLLGIEPGVCGGTRYGLGHRWYSAGLSAGLLEHCPERGRHYGHRGAAGRYAHWRLDDQTGQRPEGDRRL